MRVMIVLAIVLLSLLCGCAALADSATRFALEPGEGVYSFTHEITKDQKQAYYLAEEWLSTNIPDANKAITLRQPETCVLIANPTMQVGVGITSLWGSFTLRISIKDNKLTTLYTTGKLTNDTYPPKNAMDGIKIHYFSLSEGLLNFIETN